MLATSVLWIVIQDEQIHKCPSDGNDPTFEEFLSFLKTGGAIRDVDRLRVRVSFASHFSKVHNDNLLHFSRFLYVWTVMGTRLVSVSHVRTILSPKGREHRT